MRTIAFVAALIWAIPVCAGDILFDVAKRRAQLQRADYGEVRTHCLAPNIALNDTPDPFDALLPTEGYGSDRRGQAVAWHAMVLGARALASDAQAANQLNKLLVDWAQQHALHKTPRSHDSYYALKRTLLPLIVNYAIIRDDISNEHRSRIDAWLGPLVEKVDATFDGDVDRNNHRYLADSVLMAWGALNDDNTLYEKGITRLKAALEDARADGSLPLETRRGARATWYMRHALTNLTAMASIAQQHGKTDYFNDERLHRITHYFVTAMRAPIAVLPYAAENLIPGPNDDYFAQENDVMLRTRGHGRHYMAFAEAWMHHLPESFTTKRLHALIAEDSLPSHPLFDEYIGGNATCFFMGAK